MVKCSLNLQSKKILFVKKKRNNLINVPVFLQSKEIRRRKNNFIKQIRKTKPKLKCLNFQEEKITQNLTPPVLDKMFFCFVSFIGDLYVLYLKKNHSMGKKERNHSTV